MKYPFRSTAFGGFNKEDVTSFLDAQFQQAGAVQQKLQDDLDAAQQRLAGLSRERDELSRQLKESRQDMQDNLETVRRERDELNRQLEKVCREREADGQKQADASVCLEQAEQERDAARMQVDRLTQELDELRRQLAAVQSDAQAYAELKDRVAGVELDARRRAQGILDEAEREAQRVRSQVEQWVQQMEREYTAICGQMKDTVSQAAGRLEKAGAELEELNGLLSDQGGALEGLRHACAAADPGYMEAPVPVEIK